MKKCAVWVLLFCAAFSLFAQNTDDVTIFVPRVTGTGKSPGDNAAFTEIIKHELRSRNVLVKETWEEADYSLIGALSLYDRNAGVYTLSLMLQDKADLILYEQFLLYSTREEADIYIPTVLFNMLSSVFVMHVGGTAEVPAETPVEKAEDSEAWRNKKWYIGLNAFWNPRIYHGTKTEFFGNNFGWGISVEYNLWRYGYGEMVYLKYLSFGTGMYFTSDWIIATPKTGDDYWNMILQIPLTIYGVFKPGTIFLHEPYLGLLFNIPLRFETIPYLLSWRAGFQYGVKAGKGVVYGDIGFSMDFGKSDLNVKRPGNTRQYDRYMIYLGVGYKYDLVEPTVEFLKKIFHDIKDQKAKSVQKTQEPQVPVEETNDEAAADAPPNPEP